VAFAFVPDDAGIGPGREPAPAGTDAGTVAEASRHDAGTVPDERERTIAVLRAQVEDLQDERDRLLALLESALTERRQRRPWPGLRRWLRRVWEGEG
jgi:hypothetical protein